MIDTVGELVKRLSTFPPEAKIRCHEKGGPYETAPIGVNLQGPGLFVRVTLGPPKIEERKI